MSKAQAKKLDQQETWEGIVERIDGHFGAAMLNLAGAIETASVAPKSGEGQVEIDVLAQHFAMVRDLREEFLQGEQVAVEEYHDPRLNQPQQPEPRQRRPQQQQQPGRRPRTVPPENNREAWRIKSTGEVGFFVEDEQGENGLSYKVLELSDGELVAAPTVDLTRVR